MISEHYIKLIIRAIILLLFISGLLGMSPSFAQTDDLSNVVYLPLITHEFDPTWRWQQPQFISLSPTPNTSDPMLLSIDTLGQPLILYDTLFSPRYIYHTYPTPQGWITPAQIANTLGTSYTLFPPIRDEQGNIHLLWRNWLGTGIADPYRLMYSNFVNDTWSPEEEVSRFSSETQGMVRPDATGMMHVTSVSTFIIIEAHHFTRTPSGWSSPIEISPSHSATWAWPDYLGGIHFYGRETYPQQSVIYSYWLDDEFKTDGQLIGGDLSIGDSQLDGKNNLHLFRRAQVPVPVGTVYGVYHRCLTNNLVWTDEQVLSGQQETFSPLVKAEDGKSKIALAWQESAGNVVQVRVFNECKLTLSSSISLPSDYPWELKSAAISQSPDMFCLLARRLYTSTEYLVQCAYIMP